MIFAKKSLGQNFLRSEKALNQIISAGNITPHDLILEIGGGEGVLTEKLLQTGAKVISVEKDDRLYDVLKEKFSKEISSGQLELIHEDILRFDISKHSTYKLIANIPYNITGAILEKFLSSENQPERMVLLVQNEVAQRIIARDGKESILSISVKPYGSPRYVDKVLAGSFVPAPKVDSAIITIEGISKEFFRNFSEIEFFRMLKAGFKAKRKKLASNLAQIFGKNSVSEAFQELNLDENARAEDIELGIWQKLAEKLI